MSTAEHAERLAETIKTWLEQRDDGDTVAWVLADKLRDWSYANNKRAVSP